MEQDEKILQRIIDVEENHSRLQAETNNLKSELNKVEIVATELQTDHENFSRKATRLEEAHNRFEGKLLQIESEMLVIDQKLDSVLERLDEYFGDDEDIDGDE